MEPEPLWADLVNSDWHDHLGGGRRADRLGDDRWLAGYLARLGWRGRLPGDEERSRLRSLRSVLRRAVDALLRGESVPGRDIASLNRALAACPSVPRLAAAGGRPTLLRVPATGGIDRALGTIAASFAELLANGDPTRIKRCANPDCRWVILDETRNRTRRWCEASVCGSLIKVRRFRARRGKLGRSSRRP